MVSSLDDFELLVSPARREQPHTADLISIAKQIYNLIIKERGTLKQVEEMLQTLEVYIKIVVDIEKVVIEEININIIAEAQVDIKKENIVEAVAEKISEIDRES